jgi:hypothetical protein
MENHELCCAICEEEYELGKRDPLMLPCGHTYCSLCLKSLIYDSCIFCPEDRSQANISAIADLPKNFSLIRMIGKSRSKPEALCKDHKKCLELLCMLDNAKVCASCALFGRHQGHSIKPIEELVENISDKSKCLVKMLNNIEQSQQVVLGEIAKNRLDELCKRFCTKKAKIELEIREEFAVVKKQLSSIEEEALESMNSISRDIENCLAKIRDIPKLVDSSAINWKTKTKQLLSKLNLLTESLNFESYDKLEKEFAEILQTGEKVLVEIESIKGLDLEPYEELINSFSVEFRKTLPKMNCKIYLSNKLINVMNDKSESPRKGFNEKVFNQALEVLMFKTSKEADFTGAGDLGEMAVKIAAYLPYNPSLKKLKLVKNNISESAAVEIFHALSQNSVLNVLNLSQNSLTPASLNALIDLLNVNTTIQDIYLLGPPRLTQEYKSKLSALSSKHRRIHT